MYFWVKGEKKVNLGVVFNEITFCKMQYINITIKLKQPVVNRRNEVEPGANIYAK